MEAGQDCFHQQGLWYSGVADLESLLKFVEVRAFLVADLLAVLFCSTAACWAEISKLPMGGRLLREMAAANVLKLLGWLQLCCC